MQVFICPSPGPLLGPQPWLWSPALATNLYLSTLTPSLLLPTLAPNFSLPALAPNFCLRPWPQICVNWPWPKICIYRLWSMFLFLTEIWYLKPKAKLKVGLLRFKKFLPNWNFPQPCSKKYHHLFIWCLKLKINKF